MPRAQLTAEAAAALAPSQTQLQLDILEEPDAVCYDDPPGSEPVRKKQRLLLLDHDAVDRCFSDIATHNKVQPICGTVHVDPDPAEDPRFKDNLTPWFSSKFDGPPTRPGVFWTRNRSPNGATIIYGWQLWGGIGWYCTQVSRERARFAEATSMAPEAYQGLKATAEYEQFQHPAS